MLLLILYSCIVIPYRVGLDVAATGNWLRFDNVVTAMFLADLVLNFNTAYAEGQYLVVDRRLIAKTYLSGWFWIDLASSFPWQEADEWFESMVHHVNADEPDAPSSLRLVRALRLIRLLRLLRLMRVKQYISSLEDVLGLDLQVLQIIKLLAIVLYLTHFVGCGWFYMTLDADVPTWLSTYDGGSGLGSNGADQAKQYLYAVGWALMTLTTNSNGVIEPANDAERVYAVVGLLIGSLAVGFMLSSVANIVKTLDAHGARVQVERCAWTPTRGPNPDLSRAL